MYVPTDANYSEVKITSPLISERFDMVANKMSYLKMWNQDGFIDQINE
jgi:hypothetical protein